MNLESYYEAFFELILEYGPKLVGAIIVWIIGGIIIKALTKGFERLLNARKVDESLKPFLKGIVSALLKVMLVISVLTMLGIEMTSFVAILGAAGLAVGMALSGTLQNFAGGVMILIFKPFKNGDFIEAQGHTGTVFEIQIFNTILKTPDNKTIIVPNGGLSNGSMINYSSEEERRVDWTFGIAYGQEVTKAKQVMINLMKEDKRILTTPSEPFVAVSELGDSSVNFAVRAWVKSSDYWDVFFSMNEKIYNTFEKEHLEIPYPTMNVNLSKLN
jgi:small conductance mechanosensitive channel